MSTELLKRLYCWWFGCEVHEQDARPFDEQRCVRCDRWVGYSDRVGDTRHRRFMDWLSRLNPRRLFPKKCPDCGQRYGHSNDCIPF